MFSVSLQLLVQAIFSTSATKKLSKLSKNFNQTPNGHWNFRKHVFWAINDISTTNDADAIVRGEVFNNSPSVSRQHTPIIPDLGIKPEKKLTFLGWVNCLF